MQAQTRTLLEAMLDDLESHQLRVELVPLNPALRGYNEGGMKRVVADRNCKWYRAFCAKNLSTRKRRNPRSDTCIKRFRTIAALRAMMTGTRSTYYFAQLTAISQKYQPEQ